MQPRAGLSAEALLGAAVALSFTVLVAVGGSAAGRSPTLALAGTFGALFVTVTLLDISLGLALFAFLAYGVLTIYTTAAAVVALLVVGSCLIVLAGGDPSRKNLLRDQPAFSLLLFALVAWASVSIIWATGEGPRGDVLLRLAACAFLVAVPWTAMRSKRDTSLVLLGVTTGAIVAMCGGFAAPGRS